jgi:hypothetical protein
MNITTFLVGLASGVASAALSFALGTGSMFSLFLFVFAPLPVLIAALGWRHHAGIVGSVAGTLLVFALLGFGAARGYALSVALPAWWLAYLALLGQPVDPAAPDKGMSWYPVGRLLVWCAAIGAALVMVTLLVDGGSVENYRASLRGTFNEFFQAATNTPPGSPVAVPGGADIASITELAVIMLPPLAAAVWALIAVVNLWVAGRVVRASGRLARPWPDLAQFNLPGLTLMAVLGGLLASFLPGLVGFAAGVVCAAFAVLFSLLGLALLHVSTRQRPGRALMLGTTYFLLCVLPWMGAVLTALGIFEFLFGVRARIAAVRQPPKPTA